MSRPGRRISNIRKLFGQPSPSQLSTRAHSAGVSSFGGIMHACTQACLHHVHACCLACIAKPSSERNQSWLQVVYSPIPRLQWKLRPCWCCLVSPGPPACKISPLGIVAYQWGSASAILKLHPPPGDFFRVKNLGAHVPSCFAPGGCRYPIREQWRCCFTTAGSLLTPPMTFVVPCC